MTSRCLACFRTETDGEVTSAGGARRVVNPARKAFATLERASRGELEHIVGECTACGQPLVGDGPPVPWVIEGSTGRLVLAADGTLTLDGQRVDWPVARGWLDAQFPEKPESGGLSMGPIQAMLLVVMLTPIAVWLFSVVFVSVFLYRFPESPP